MKVIINIYNMIKKELGMFKLINIVEDNQRSIENHYKKFLQNA